MDGFELEMNFEKSAYGIYGWEQVEVIYDSTQQRRSLGEFFARVLKTLALQPEPEPGDTGLPRSRGTTSVL